MTEENQKHTNIHKYGGLKEKNEWFQGNNKKLEP